MVSHCVVNRWLYCHTCLQYSLNLLVRRQPLSVWLDQSVYVLWVYFLDTRFMLEKEQVSSCLTPDRDLIKTWELKTPVRFPREMQLVRGNNLAPWPALKVLVDDRYGFRAHFPPHLEMPVLGPRWCTWLSSYNLPLACFLLLSTCWPLKLTQ